MQINGTVLTATSSPGSSALGHAMKGNQQDDAIVLVNQDECDFEVKMPFANFTNPYRDPADAPEEYRKHPSLKKLFREDGNYVRPAEDPVTIWAVEILHKEYGVPLEAMELELSADFAEGTHRGGRRYLGRADVVI
jgi:hypothetical protein